MDYSDLNEDKDDVLNTVPHLPTLQNDESAATIAAAHYASPRRVSMAEVNPTENARHQSSISLAGPIYLRIVRSNVPTRIQKGLEELAKHAPRKNIFLVNKEPDEVPALDKTRNGGPVWWWNVQ